MMCVVTIGEDRAAVSQRAVGGMNHANRECLHAARKRVLVLRFDDEVEMVRLNREVHHPKVILLARGDRATHRLEEQAIAPKAWKTFAGPHRHMYRMARHMSLAPAMWHPSSDS